MNQRWNNRKSTFVGGVIDPSLYFVDVVPWRDAKLFVEQHHYSGSFPAAVRRYGLYRLQHQSPDLLSGVAVFSQPANQGTLSVFGPARSAELGRFILRDEVPGNGESWFIARCFEQLRSDGFAGVVSFSDPIPRTTSEGTLIFPGHIGTIYQASNGRHAGRSRARTLQLLPDGTVFSERAAAKVASGDRGAAYSAALLQRWGAGEVWEDPRAWLRHWVGRLCRPMRHPGCIRYLWGLDRRTRRGLPEGQPYPKRGR